MPIGIAQDPQVDFLELNHIESVKSAKIVTVRTEMKSQRHLPIIGDLGIYVR